MKNIAATLGILLSLVSGYCAPAKDGITFQGKEGPGKGKHLVFLAGDEEYRSEEALPQLAKILSTRHGFTCTVLFSFNPTNGLVDPVNVTSMHELAALEKADMVVMLLRFREWPDDQMKHFVDYVNSGKPILALRTSTHAFSYERNKTSPYAKYDWRSKEWPGGFGQQVLGETWVNHHGVHAKESTRGVINEKFKTHPILKGAEDIWGPTDVYTVTHLPSDAQVLVYGQVLEGMNPTDKPLAGPKNDPMMPVVWLRDNKGETGKTSKIITTTMGSARDLQSEGFRRMLVNACYWGVGLGNSIPARANVDLVGSYEPSGFGFGKYKQGLKPADE